MTDNGWFVIMVSVIAICITAVRCCYWISTKGKDDENEKN
jgi:hypothetical protein